MCSHTVNNPPRPRGVPITCAMCTPKSNFCAVDTQSIPIIPILKSQKLSCMSQKIWIIFNFDYLQPCKICNKDCCETLVFPIDRFICSEPPQCQHWPPHIEFPFFYYLNIEKITCHCLALIHLTPLWKIFTCTYFNAQTVM